VIAPLAFLLVLLVAFLAMGLDADEPPGGGA